MTEPKGPSIGPDETLALRRREIGERGWRVDELRGGRQDLAYGWALIEGEHEEQRSSRRWEIEHPYGEGALQPARERQRVDARPQWRLLEYARQLDERQRVPCGELHHPLTRPSVQLRDMCVEQVGSGLVVEPSQFHLVRVGERKRALESIPAGDHQGDGV